jgi:hypothetical protein
MKKPSTLKKLVIAVTFTLTTAITMPVMAGSQSNAKANFSANQIADFAKQVEHYAARQGARAFIIGRIGQDPKGLPRGIKFTHTAIAVYSQIRLKNGESAKGYVIHNLYQRNKRPNKSDLVTDFPVDFFWGAQRLSAGISIPTPAVQQRLIEAINNGVAKQVHNPNYSVIANPMNDKYQNCTEHTLLVLNSAIYQTTNLDRLYANNKAYFTPQRVHSSPFKLMLGNAFVSGVTTADHKSKVNTATFGSISRYLNNYDLLYKSVTLNANGRITNNI